MTCARPGPARGHGSARRPDMIHSAVPSPGCVGGEHTGSRTGRRASDRSTVLQTARLRRRSPVSSRVETLEFQAEARQLLQLMVHSIYSNKDIFLRELVSNASDALDKLRLESLINKELQVDTSDLHIEVELEKPRRAVTVRDNGVGMSRDEVVQLIGTIAKSGTAELVRKLKESKDAPQKADLIGQFGVGFYSTFMVAAKVELLTRRAGESTGIRW